MPRITPEETLAALGGNVEGLKAIGSAAMRIANRLEAGTIPDVHHITLATGSKVGDLAAHSQGLLRILSRNLSDVLEIDAILSKGYEIK